MKAIRILLTNIDKIHTNKMGIDRIKKNIKLDISNIVEYCKNKVFIFSSYYFYIKTF